MRCRVGKIESHQISLLRALLLPCEHNAIDFERENHRKAAIIAARPKNEARNEALLGITRL